jgi:hypothetical protein
MGRPRKPLSSKRRKLFLAELARHGNITRASEVIGVTRQAAFYHRQHYPDFAAAWDAAAATFDDMLESEAAKRAAVGVEKPIYFKGVVVGHVREFSDRLLEFLLDRRRYPAKSKHELSGPDGAPIEVREVVDLIVDPAKPGGD